MPRHHVDRLTRSADAARPELGIGRSPIAVALAAGGGWWGAAMVGGRFTQTGLVALARGRAHVFEARWAALSLRVGQYRGALRPDELVFVNGGRVHDDWELLGHPARALRVHRSLLDAVAGQPRS